MRSLENIRDVFAIFHDGTIASHDFNKNALTLTIDCNYLAVLLDESFTNFFVELTDIETLCLSTWPNPFDQPVKVLTDQKEIFEAELEILSAEIKDDVVLVSCNQSDKSFDYSGGTLSIACKKIKVFDHTKIEISIDKLDELCRKYWDNFGRKV